MIFGLLLIIFILYGFLLFWVLHERLKSLAYSIRKTNDALRRTEEQLNLIVNLIGGKGESPAEDSIPEHFTLDALSDEDEAEDNNTPEGDLR